MAPPGERGEGRQNELDVAAVRAGDPQHLQAQKLAPRRQPSAGRDFLDPSSLHASGLAEEPRIHESVGRQPQHAGDPAISARDEVGPRQELEALPFAQDGRLRQPALGALQESARHQDEPDERGDCDDESPEQESQCRNFFRLRM